MASRAVENGYATYADACSDCQSAVNPLGRSVCSILGESGRPFMDAASDALCTGFQLATDLQNVRTDGRDHGRVMIPAEFFQGERFRERLLETTRAGRTPDPKFLEQFGAASRAFAQRIDETLAAAQPLIDASRPENQPFFWMCLADARALVREFDLWNHESCLARPTLSVWTECSILSRAAWRSFFVRPMPLLAAQ